MSEAADVISWAATADRRCGDSIARTGFRVGEYLEYTEHEYGIL